MWLVLAIVFIILAVLLFKKEGFGMNDIVSNNTVKGGHYSYFFYPSNMTTYFEGDSPSLEVENDYHRAVGALCGGKYEDKECLQKCYYLAMKKGTTDIKDRICESRASNFDEYMRCLDDVYTDYHWSPRMNPNLLLE